MNPQRSVNMPQSVVAVFSRFPADIREKLLLLRQLILQVAAKDPVIGRLEETLKWGEPAYLTADTGAGTTIRLSWTAKTPGKYRVMVNCQTTLVDSYRVLFPELEFEGNRALVLDVNRDVDHSALALCIEMALTYHAAKKRDKRSRR
ncbi:MAG: hypothetical protein ABJ013_05780 [Halioglobus sp.]